MRLLVLSHDEYSLPGSLGQCFSDLGFEVSRHVVVDDPAHPISSKPFPEVTDFDVIMPMGAPWSVYDTALIGTWIGRERMLLSEAHTLGIPILAICFGAQALASTLGGSVEPAASYELGWSTIESDVPERIVAGPWFQWHGDRFSIPAGATELARNAQGPQAFTSLRSLGVQFHPEVDAGILETWLSVGGSDTLAAHGVDSEKLLAETRERETNAYTNVARLVDFFLREVASSEPQSAP